jgi:hypothetical protein
MKKKVNFAKEITKKGKLVAKIKKKKKIFEGLAQVGLIFMNMFIIHKNIHRT